MESVSEALPAEAVLSDGRGEESNQAAGDQAVVQTAKFGLIPDSDDLAAKLDSSKIVFASAVDAPMSSDSMPELLPAPEPVMEPIPDASSTADTQTFTLQGALSTSLAQNPDLMTLRGQVNVNRTMVGVAEAPIWNPFVQIQFLPRGSPYNKGTGRGTGAGKTNYYIWAMQRFELAHQRRHRTQSALAALDQVQWNIFQAELINVSQTASLYFAALYQKDLYDLTIANTKLNEHLLEVMERRQQANLATQSAVATARIAARQSRRQMELAESNYMSAILALRQQMNLPVNVPLVLEERLSDLQWLPVRGEGEFRDQESLAADLVQGRPDVMAAQVGIQVAQANWMLARAAMVPDIQAGPIFDTSDAGTTFLGLRLQMDLPVRNTGAPLERQRCAEVAQQSLTCEQLKIKAAQQAYAAINQYERIRLIAEDPLAARPDVRRELDEMLRLFEAGQADVLMLINTQNSLLQQRRIDLDVLNQLGISAAAVIQATGLPIDRLVTSRNETPTPLHSPTEG